MPADFIDAEPLEGLTDEMPKDPDALENRREPASMRSLIEKTVRRLNLPLQDLWREEVVRACAQVIPADVAPLLRPAKWEHGVLYFYVPNNISLFQIQRQYLRAIETGLRNQLGPSRLRQVRLMITPEAWNTPLAPGQ